jgi:hypothetical protein
VTPMTESHTRTRAQRAPARATRAHTSHPTHPLQRRAPATSGRRTVTACTLNTHNHFDVHKSHARVWAKLTPPPRHQRLYGGPPALSINNGELEPTQPTSVHRDQRDQRCRGWRDNSRAITVIVLMPFPSFENHRYELVRRSSYCSTRRTRLANHTSRATEALELPTYLLQHCLAWRLAARA